MESEDDYIINACLSIVPNLERLSIYRDFFQINIPQYLKHDWHSSSIARYLPLLRQFNYYFKTWYMFGVDGKFINTFGRMKEQFSQVHDDQYQAQIHFNLSC